MSSTLNIEVIPNLIGGKQLRIQRESFTPVHNPSTGEVIAQTPMGGEAEVRQAAEAAAKAYEHWSQTTPQHRATILFRYKQLLEDHFIELSKLVTRENGKTHEEAKGDVRRGIEVVEFCCGIPHLLKGEAIPQIAEQIDGLTTREPIGVCAGIAPFNFPAMVPMWMFPVAIACGNTFILKPSEKVPLTAVRLAELFEEAGLPEGVLNIVHGGKEVVDALCTHPKIAAVSFVGSSPVAKHVYDLGCSHGKRVQAAGGAKNVLVVMPDAEPDPTLRAIMGSSFGCAGQRCMAGSLLLPVGEAADLVRNQVVHAMDSLKIGDTSKDESVQMGPVIDEGARQRVAAAIANHEKQLARDGRNNIPEKGFFVGPTLIDNVTTESTLFTQEIFGPVLGMMRPRTLDEAIEWTKKNGYGNGATIFTTSGASARHFVREIPCGMVGVNVGVPAPMAVFSFSGWNDSFYGDLHMQGKEGIMFFTRQKMVLARWDTGYERKHGW